MMIQEHAAAVENVSAADFTRLIADWAEIEEIRGVGALYDLTGFEVSPVLYDPR